MHVKIEPVTGVVISTRLTKQGWRIRENKPKDGWWKVVWKRKRGKVKEISGILTKRKAEDLAATLNTLSGRQVGLLVRSLHSAGAQAHREYEVNNKVYTGRSFARG